MKKSPKRKSSKPRVKPGLTLQAEAILAAAVEDERLDAIRQKRLRILKWCAAPFLFVGYKLWETLQGVGFVVAWVGVAFGFTFSAFYIVGFVIQLLLPADITMAIVTTTAKGELPCFFCFFPSQLQIAALGIQSTVVIVLLLLLLVGVRSAFRHWFPANWAKVKRRLNLE